MTRRGARWWRLAAVADGMRTRLWPIPLVAVILAAVLGVMLPLLDERVDSELPSWFAKLLFSGGPDASRAVLSSIAGSLITVTSLTFSLTVVTLQLASSQFSPRLLRTFTRDRVVHATLGLFLATFTYSLVVLRTVHSSGADQSEFVPQLAITLAVLLALASVVALVLFLAHLTRQIRVETMLREVHDEAAVTISRVLGDEVDLPTAAKQKLPVVPAGATPLLAKSSGFVALVDEDRVLEEAVGGEAFVLITRLPGAQVVAGTPVGYTWPLEHDARRDLCRLADTVASSVEIYYERTSTQDVGIGLRQLTDVAVKALSPGINDPTTAIHALGHSAALLCVLVCRDLGPHLLRDDEGVGRVMLNRPELADLLDLAVAQPARYGAKEPAVLIRLLQLLREVAWSTSLPSHHDAVRVERSRVVELMENNHYTILENSALRSAVRSLDAAFDGEWETDSSRQ